MKPNSLYDLAERGSAVRRLGRQVNLGIKMESEAYFSPQEQYRYLLVRTFGCTPKHGAFKGGLVGFLMLNPSTATELLFDPTVRRCFGYAVDWGFGGFMVANLFAFRATDPSEMKRSGDAVGPLNDQAILEMAEECDLIICAWGTHGRFLGRDQEVKALLRPHADKVKALKLTKDGHPSHPLYLKSDLQPMAFGI